MISVVLYGRNDNYGYNLHKRAALSINCIAEVLDGKDDEILFVDYNTPDDMPTFIEAILDTLTDRARRRLRVLRARPALHRRFAGRTRLFALEPHARNIAVRRSNPDNRWILSTNTDMVFVLRGGQRSLNTAVADLKPGYYGVPRYEMPETLWESLDRRDPKGVIAAFADWGRRLHLDEVVHSHRSILFDAPGDFQLVPRQDLCAIHGFNEGMLLGWHVDSNLAKRFLLLHGATHSLFERVASYHCDHTKVATPMHGHDRQQNSLVTYVTEVTAPGIPGQAESWGAPDVAVEELRFPPGQSIGFAKAVAPILGPMKVPVYDALYTEKSWNRLTYPARHVLPYLADQLATYPRDIELAYAGMNDTLRDLLAELWRALGFTGRMLVLDRTAGVKPGCAPPPARPEPGYVVADLDHLIAHGGLFVFDFGLEDGPDWPMPIFHPKANPKSQALLPLIKALQVAGLKVVAAERARAAEGLPPRRLVLVNTINTEFAGMLEQLVAQTITPYCTRVRHGVVKPDAVEILRQRQAEAERLGQSIGQGLIEESFKSIPLELLDARDPHLLLSDAQRSDVTDALAKLGDKDWPAVAKVALSMLTGDAERRLAALLAAPLADPEQFKRHVSMLRLGSHEAMGRPWPPGLAAIIVRACKAFLDGAAAVPAELRAQAITAMVGLCRGAPGMSLGALAAALDEYACLRLGAPGADESDAWSGLAVAALRVGHGMQADNLLAAGLSRIVAAAGPAASSVRHSIAVIAAAPWRSGVDPAAAKLDALIARWAASGAERPSLAIYPLVPPEAAFVAFAEKMGATVANAPGGDDHVPMELKLRALALADVLRARDTEAALLLGDSVAGLATLALRVAPLQAAAGRIARPGLPGIDTLLADQDAVTAWLAAVAKPAGAKSAGARGAAVVVAAR
ncbi:MAG: hypothetical protein L6R19_05655 [Alphaproteobacteria bacterium]|nr:hypothetical protein [Alphaproteobacteria bacterium]